MSEFEVRRVRPKEGLWYQVSGDTIEQAIMDDFAAYPQDRVVYSPDKDLPGNTISFCVYEDRKSEMYVARLYESSIRRKSGILDIDDVAKRLGWKGAPGDLLEEGWEQEE